MGDCQYCIRSSRHPSRSNRVVLQAMLQQVAGSGGDSTPLSGYVLNVNVPSVPFRDLRGYYLARQGMACVYPRFQEVSGRVG